MLKWPGLLVYRILLQTFVVNVSGRGFNLTWTLDAKFASRKRFFWLRCLSYNHKTVPSNFRALQRVRGLDLRKQLLAEVLSDVPTKRKIFA